MKQRDVFQKFFLVFNRSNMVINIIRNVLH